MAKKSAGRIDVERPVVTLTECTKQNLQKIGPTRSAARPPKRSRGASRVCLGSISPTAWMITGSCIIRSGLRRTTAIDRSRTLKPAPKANSLQKLQRAFRESFIL
jgi:hypothetical protein